MPSTPPFVHLAARTSFSLRDGVIRPRELAVATAERGMDRVGVADRDGLYGAVRVAQACAEVGLRPPLLGADLALAADERRPGWEDRRARRHGRKGPASGAAWLDDDTARVVLIARTQAGYADLCRTISDHHLESPRG
ncbi:MAG TPA: PHP domain-containing protein, partial [Egibacteraceae bacterium]